MDGLPKSVKSEPTSPAGTNKAGLGKKILLSVTASALTLVVAALAAEVYLRWKQSRLVVPDYEIELRTHDGQKISMREGGLKLSLAPFTVYKNLPSQRTSSFSINSRGLRAVENAERDPSPKILFLGGSAAFGQGARSDQETIQHTLEQSMKSHRVLNAGVVGFLSGQELAYLVTELADYHPTIVVAYDGWNDLFDALYSDGRDYNQLGFNNNFFSIGDQLLLNYQTQVSIPKSLGRLTAATSTKSLLVTRVIEKFFTQKRSGRTISKDRLDGIVLSYATNLQKMALFSRARGARFIVIFQPELGQKPRRTSAEQKMLSAGIANVTEYQGEFSELYRQFLSKAKQLLTRDGIEWLDINENPKYVESTDELFLDVVHTNRRGNELVADIIGQRLIVSGNPSKKELRW